MAILYRNKIIDLLENKELIIESTDERIPFDPDTQITSDTIELRLSPKGLVYNKGLEFVDTLANDPEELFELVLIPVKGYILEPGHILFSSTLEIVCIASTIYTGRISTRGTFSRFGLSVTCGRSRVQAGTPHTPSLQIANHTSKPVKIYPYTFMLQLQLETTSGVPQPYEGIYPKSIGPVAPRISERDRAVSTLLSKIASGDKSAQPTPDQHTAVQIAERISVSVKQGQKSQLKISMPSKLRSLFGLVFGGLTTIAGGFLINMLSTGEWSYWKIVSVAFAGTLLIVFLVLDLLVILGSDSE